MGLRQSKPQYFDLDHELSAPLRSTLKDVEHLFIRPRRLKITAGNQVGVGGYGEVMLATLDKSRNVAVKQLRAVGTKGDRKRLALRLARELKIWATLQHPNILGLLGYYLSKNYEIAQLISVYMVNGNVSQYLNQNQPDITTRLKLVQGITSGLQYLHDFNPPICHGDLKPANVLISDELDAVICDLGVASFINEAEGPSGLTTTRAVKGSSRYMSPELLLEGEGKQTLASDIWAWACTTYEIFTNIEPYSEVKTNGAVIAEVLRSKAPGSIQVLLSRLPQDTTWPTKLSGVINDSWNFDSSKRPSVTTLIRATNYPSNELANRSTEQPPIPIDGEDYDSRTPTELGLGDTIPNPVMPIRDVRQMQSAQPEVDKVKATKDRRRRSPQATNVLFPRESRLRNYHSKGRLAIDEIALVDRPKPPSAETTGPPPTVLSPAFQIPYSDANDIRPLDMLFEPPFYPFIHQRQRSVFKRIDCVLRGYPHSKNGDRSSLKPSPSTTSLPDLTASIPPQPTELDQESPRSLPGPIRFRRHCYSLTETQNGISLKELLDGLLSTDGKPSAKIKALDRTNRLSERTETKVIGAYSDVSRAKLDNHLVVAVKALRAANNEGTDEAIMRKRLGGEIYVWAALRHPNILKFLGFAFEGGRPCLISPWCEHGTLQSYLTRYRGADRGSLVYQIAEGLKYLHLQKPPVVHGDLEPANVLITKDHIAKICDFGGSKRLGEGGTGCTPAGFVSTTIRYSAPETLQEDDYHTLQSDVYSFACVALETLSGKYPFWKISKPAVIITKVALEKETPSPGDHPDLKDDMLWELLRRCWNYEPSDRPKMFAVCRELAKAGYRPSHYLVSAWI